MEQDYLTRAEVAALYPISLSCLEKAKPELGGPPILRLGRKVLFKRTAFEAWLDSHQAGSSRLPQPQRPEPRRPPSKSKQMVRQGES